MYYTCRHFSPLHWSEKCGGGPVISPFFCSGHHGWRDIIHFFWHPFQSSLGGATGQGCHPRPAEGLADAAFSWSGWNSVLCFTAGARGSKEWQLCPFNLYALPPSSSLRPLTPSFEPMVPEIDLFIMIIFWSTGFCWVSHLAKRFEKKTGVFPFSLTHCYS